MNKLTKRTKFVPQLSTIIDERQKGVENLEHQCLFHLYEMFYQTNHLSLV